MRRLSRFGIAALVGFSTSFVIALVSYAFGTWLGGHSDNLRDTVYFTVPFALLLGAAAALPPTWQSIRKRRVITAVLVGAILGLLYTFLLFKFVALGFLAIVVQAISCWVAGGISGMLAVAVVKRSRMVSAIVGVCLLAIFVPTPLFNAVTRNQQLTVAFVTRSLENEATASPRTLFFDNAAEVHAVSKQVLEHVHALRLTGNFRVAHLSRQGEGKQSLAIIVVQGPVEQRALLAEPDGSTVIYVQESGGWAKHPADAPTLRRSIEVWPPMNRSEELAFFSVPKASGISLLGTIREQHKDQSPKP